MISMRDESLKSVNRFKLCYIKYFSRIFAVFKTLTQKNIKIKSNEVKKLNTFQEELEYKT